MRRAPAGRTPAAEPTREPCPQRKPCYGTFVDEPAYCWDRSRSFADFPGGPQPSPRLRAYTRCTVG